MSFDGCFEQYVRQNYVAACDRQRELQNDVKMLEMLHSRQCGRQQVKSWMRDYGLFQGITNKVRDQVAGEYIEYVDSYQPSKSLDEVNEIRAQFTELYLRLFHAYPRTWTSAVSKLLWCLEPEKIVIYDSFVHRAIVVLQPLDANLLKFSRVKSGPQVKKKSDIEDAVTHYVNFQSIVRDLADRFASTLHELREEHGETYKYDIRIIDKLLWMIGDPSWEFVGM